MTKSLLLLTTLILLLGKSQAAEVIIKDDANSNCYVYTPPRVNKSKTYWLVVGVHSLGGSGKGAAGIANWAKKGDCIVIGPSFQNGYQAGNGKSAAKLLKLQKTLSATYKLHDKMFIHGFSAGAQFAHRFTFNHPKHVLGCSAHSAGSWATGGQWASISTKAKTIPFVLSCGEKDTGKAFSNAPMNRLEWFEEFSAQMQKKGFKCVSKTLPRQGHRISPEVFKMAKQCFDQATQ